MQTGPVAQSGQGAVPLEKKRKPPEPVVVGSKPTGPASPWWTNAI